MPKGSFYHFFPQGKEALALAVVVRYAQDASAHRKAAFGSEREPPLERIRTHFSSYRRGFEANGYRHGCLLGNLSAEIADHVPALREKIEATLSEWAGDIAVLLSEAQMSGAVDRAHDAPATARLLVQSWQGALLGMKAEKSPRALEDFDRLFFDALLRPRREDG